MDPVLRIQIAYSPTLVVTGDFAENPRLSGRRSSAIMGVLFSESAMKGAQFSIGSAASAKIPVLFLQNITGFMVGFKGRGGAGHRQAWREDAVHAVCERSSAEIHRCRSAGLTGLGNYGCAFAPMRPRLMLHVWPNSAHLRQGGEQAANVLADCGPRQ